MPFLVDFVPQCIYHPLKMVDFVLMGGQGRLHRFLFREFGFIQIVPQFGYVFPERAYFSGSRVGCSLDCVLLTIAGGFYLLSIVDTDSRNCWFSLAERARAF